MLKLQLKALGDNSPSAPDPTQSTMCVYYSPRQDEYAVNFQWRRTSESGGDWRLVKPPPAELANTSFEYKDKVYRRSPCS